MIPSTPAEILQIKLSRDNEPYVELHIRHMSGASSSTPIAKEALDRIAAL